MSALKIQKNLLGLNDILMGRNAKQQIRGDSAIIIRPFRLVLIADSLGDLRAANPQEYDTAILKAPDEDFNNFYFYDYDSEEPENVPYVIASNPLVKGRWKVVGFGTFFIKKVVDDELELAAEDIASRVQDKLEDRIDKLVILKVEELTYILRKQGGVHFVKDGFSYDKFNFVTAFTSRDGIITERVFMVKDFQNPLKPLVESPLTGDVEDFTKDLIIYKDNENLKINPAFTEVMAYKHLETSIRLQANKNYQIFTDDKERNPKGLLKCRILKEDKVSVSFEVKFSGMNYKEFTLSNVSIAPELRKFEGFLDNGYPFLPGFAIVANGSYFGISVTHDEFCDTLEVDFTEMNYAPILKEMDFSKLFSFAIRPNGGSFLPGLGVKTFTSRKVEDTPKESFNFYLFAQGAILYNSSTTLDPDIYHSYIDSGCLLPDLTLEDRHLRTASDSKPLGTLEEPHLPNVKWKGSKDLGTYVTNVDIDRDPGLAGSMDSKSVIRSWNQSKGKVVQSWDYDASRDCSPIYKDGVNDVMTKSAYFNIILICY